MRQHYDQSTWYDQDTSSTSSSIRRQPKRQRSLYTPMHSVTQGFATRLGSISRRWKTRSATVPQLSIITHHPSFPSSRKSTDISGSWSSRHSSVASPLTDICSPTSIHSVMEETIPESEMVPIFMDHNEPIQEEDDPVMATTPLLPPTMLDLGKQDSPLQSPLQSPSIVPTGFGHHHSLSASNHAFSCLPSPPLSTRPSMTSMSRSRAPTATEAIPPLYLQPDQVDPWSQKLGHADFSIHPEPYYPQTYDISSYEQFRANWSQARKQYAQHLARTDENYGATSKVYKLTEEKWESIDMMWKNNDARLRRILGPQLARLSDQSTSPDSPISLLDRPVTRIEIPELDKSGKFPELGDADIVGPLQVGAAKVPELRRGQYTPPTSPRKRNLIRYLGDMFKH